MSLCPHGPKCKQEHVSVLLCVTMSSTSHLFEDSPFFVNAVCGAPLRITKDVPEHSQLELKLGSVEVQQKAAN